MLSFANRVGIPDTTGCAPAETAPKRTERPQEASKGGKQYLLP